MPVIVTIFKMSWVAIIIGIRRVWGGVQKTVQTVFLRIPVSFNAKSSWGSCHLFRLEKRLNAVIATFFVRNQRLNSTW